MLSIGGLLKDTIGCVKNSAMTCRPPSPHQPQGQDCHGARSLGRMDQCTEAPTPTGSVRGAPVSNKDTNPMSGQQLPRRTPAFNSKGAEGECTEYICTQLSLYLHHRSASSGIWTTTNLLHFLRHFLILTCLRLVWEGGRVIRLWGILPCPRPRSWDWPMSPLWSKNATSTATRTPGGRPSTCDLQAAREQGSQGWGSEIGEDVASSSDSDGPIPIHRHANEYIPITDTPRPRVQGRTRSVTA